MTTVGVKGFGVVKCGLTVNDVESDTVVCCAGHGRRCALIGSIIVGPN